MNQLHIVTVGISLLTNYAKAKNLTPNTALKQSKQLRAFLKADPRTASAEINSLDSRVGLLKKVPKGLGVSLVYSATAGNESVLTARLIASFLKQQGISVVELKLKDIAAPANPATDPKEAARLAQQGLLELREKVRRHVERMKQRFPDLTVQFNVTGGYKAETAVLYELACALGIPVYYLHETYKIDITLPELGPVPF